MRRLEIVIFLLFLLPGIYAQDVSVKTKLEKEKILIGDQIQLKYAIEKKEGLSVGFPVKNKKITDQIEIIDSVKIDSLAVSEKKRTINLDYTITAFDTGRFEIPPYPVYVRHKDFTDTIFSAAVFLQVNGVAIDSTKTIRDIKPIEELKFPWKKALIIVGISLIGLILLLILVYYIILRYRKVDILGRPHRKEPPHIIALRQLDKLKAEKAWQKGEIKDYYSRLTFIIRNYIERRFNIIALEETSDEIMEDFGKLNVYGDEIASILKNLLDLADLVKFAKNQPLPDENMKHLDSAYIFIKRTKEQEETDDLNKGEGKWE